MTQTEPFLHTPSVPDSASREPWIDCLRGLGIVLMVLGHASLPEAVRVWIYGFHMPLFYMISGYLHNEVKWKAAGFRCFCTARAKNYLVPYFLWCAVCFVLNLPVLYMQSGAAAFPEALLENLGWILTSVRIDGVFLPQNCTPLWFLTSLFVSQLCFYGVLRLRPAMQAAACAAFICANHLLQVFAVPVLPWHLDVSLIGTVFMLAGFCLRRYRILCLVKKRLAVLGTAAFAFLLISFNGRNGHAEMYYRSYGSCLLFLFSAVLMSFCLMWFCRNARKRILEKPLSVLGRYSVVVLGLNYTVNTAAKGMLPLLVNDPGSVYGMILRTVLILVLDLSVFTAVIRIFRKYADKHRILRLFLGKQNTPAHTGPV